MTSQVHLSPTERARCYRELAAAARRDALKFEGTTREGFIHLAEGWERLADTIDEWIRGHGNLP